MPLADRQSDKKDRRADRRTDSEGTLVKVYEEWKNDGSIVPIAVKEEAEGAPRLIGNVPYAYSLHCAPLF
jgi:hypothetical protein